MAVVDLKPSLAKKRRESVRTNIRELAQEYFNWRLEEFHLEMLQAMFAGGKLIINVPTDHAKSTMGCFLFPLLSLMENPDETHLICGANINDSKRRVAALTREIETNTALTRDFPWIAKPQDKDGRIWATMQFNVAGRTVNKPNPSVYAGAIGSNDIRGRRGKLMMDDIEGADVRYSPLKRQQMYTWLTMEAWRCFEDKHESERPLLCLLGTPFDIDSIYFRMEHHRWKPIRYSCYLDGGLEPDEVKVDAMGMPWKEPRYTREYLWPDKKEKVEEARRTLRKLAFSVQYLMDPTGGDPTKLSETQLRKLTQEATFEHDRHLGLVSVDPAAGGQTNARADYAGVVVVRIHWQADQHLPDVELLEAFASEEGLFEQVHMAADLSARHAYPVILEGNSQQWGTYSNAFMHLHPETPLLRHYTTNTAKFDDKMGLTVVKRLAIDRRLKVPESKLDTEGIVQFITELRDLAPPFKLHNHISAAVWFAVRYAYEQVRYHNVGEIRSTYGHTRNQFGFGQPSSPYYGGRPPAVTAYRKFGFQPAPMYHNVLEQEMQKELERFQQAVRPGRPA